MRKLASWSPAPSLNVHAVQPGDGGWTVEIDCLAPAQCPACGVISRSRHSSYMRTLRDLPAQGTPVIVHARVRRWRCRNLQCTRKIFVGRLPDLAAPFERRTTRLAGIVRLLGYSAGGRPAERLLTRLGMPVSDTTILRRLKRAAAAQTTRAVVRVAGIDEWAWRKGFNYGTVIVDLERRQVVDLLADRSAATMAEWLKAYPEIEAVNRDRAGLYADAVRQGAPQARQIADRFHILKNFRETIERQLGRIEAPIRGTAASIESDRSPVVEAAVETFDQVSGAIPERPVGRGWNAACLAMFDQVRSLYEAGGTVRDIARKLGLGHRRVGRWVCRIDFPERNVMAPKPSNPAYVGSFLARCWAEGTTKIRHLFSDIRHRGYTGSFSNLARFVAPWRVGTSGNTADPCGSDEEALEPSNLRTLDPTSGRQISPITAAFLCVKPRGQMTPSQIANLNALKAASTDFVVMRQLALRLRGLLRGGTTEKLDVWLSDAHRSDIHGMRRFARTVKQDLEAVRNAVLEPWSNGQTEGQINRLKTLKRAMYGRAGVDLLRARMLLLPDIA